MITLISGPEGGTSEPTPSSAYYSNIEDALYAGDIKRAKALVLEMAKNPLTQHDHLLAALQQSMTAKQPIPGGTAGSAFYKWAQAVLPPQELARIEDAQNEFVKSAIAAGIFKPGAIKTHMVGAPKKGAPSRKLLMFNPEVIATPAQADKFAIVRSGAPNLADQIQREKVAAQLMLT